MAAAARATSAEPRHVPVLLRPLIAAVSPVSGHWIDGTLGAGGYTQALLDAGADRVTAIDRDPLALEMAREWGAPYSDRLHLVAGTFSEMDSYAGALVDGVVLDLGVSSMQLDEADRGFSFMRDGPLDMRMGQSGPSAADLVNGADEGALADILYHYGEERAARRIAKAIVAARANGPITTTRQLAEIVESKLPRSKPGQSHPATRSFQAIRIAVNDEFGQLISGLEAAERALKPGGLLAVVTFHSLEDRVVKRFLLARSDAGGGGSRYAPERAPRAPGLSLETRRATGPDDQELAENPRARSSRLRVARRTDAPASAPDRTTLGLPKLALKKGT